MTYRSVSLKRTDSRTVTSESPKRMILHKSLNFKQLEPTDEIMPQNAIAFENHRSDNSINEFMSCKNEATLSLKPTENGCSSPRRKCELDAAAVKLQKAYKSYRTRRNLADCAVVVEELWWKAMDFASLKHNSPSFFSVEKQETVVSGGRGRGQRRPRLIERESFEVIFECGKLIYKQSEKPVNTTEDSKWIFVLSTTRTLYIGQKKKGTFQHSSFLAGGATTAAGRLVAKEGTLLAIWPYSGHYLPTEENFKEFISFLEENNVDLTTVKRCSIEDDDYKSESVSETVVLAEAASEVDSAVASHPKESVKPEHDMAEVAAKAFELTKRLSSKWTTGTGPRIGCVRDYPSELQFKALEQVNLSPRGIPSPSMNKWPIPSPRPSPKIRLSPRLAYMGIPSPIVSLTLPTPKRK